MKIMRDRADLHLLLDVVDGAVVVQAAGVSVHDGVVGGLGGHTAVLPHVLEHLDDGDDKMKVRRRLRSILVLA